MPRCDFDDQSAIWAYPCLFAAVHTNGFAAGTVNCKCVPFLAFQNRPDPIDHNGVSLIQKAVRFKFGELKLAVLLPNQMTVILLRSLASQVFCAGSLPLRVVFPPTNMEKPKVEIALI